MNGIYVVHTSVTERACSKGICEACRHRDQPRTLIELFGIRERVCSQCLRTRKEWLVFRHLMTISGAHQELMDRITHIKAGGQDQYYDNKSQSLILDEGDFLQEISA
jgi:hypothetical protein